MKEIQPIGIWKDGILKQASFFKMYISYDDMMTTATFQYQLLSNDLCAVAEGKLQIQGIDYTNWGITGDSNAEAYVYGAQALFLTIIADYTPPINDSTDIIIE